MHFNSQKFGGVSKQLCCDFTTVENDLFQVIFFYSCILSFFFLFKNIRIHHECDGGIEKSVPRITDWHHEACRVMPNGDREGRIFLSHTYTNNGVFFLLTT